MAAPHKRTPVFMTEYARGLLECHACCKSKYEKVEQGFADLQALETETWEEDDHDGLEEFLRRMDTESEACYNQFSEVQSNNIEIFERWMTLTAPAKPPTIRQTQAAPNITSVGFKPNTDLNPTFLIKDCTLTEFNKFTETFLTYMGSSGSTVPAEALWGQLKVNMDSYWFTELKDKGFLRQSDLTSFQTLMDEVALIKFPIHQRRMVIFSAKQTGDPLSYLRELIEHIRVADWTTFTKRQRLATCSSTLSNVKNPRELASKLCLNHPKETSKA